MLAGNNEGKRWVDRGHSQFTRFEKGMVGSVGWHIPVFLLVLCRAVVVGESMIRVLLPIRSREGEYSPRLDQTDGLEG
jgi:hypothetical protein